MERLSFYILKRMLVFGCVFDFWFVFVFFFCLEFTSIHRKHMQCLCDEDVLYMFSMWVDTWNHLYTQLFTLVYFVFSSPLEIVTFCSRTLYWSSHCWKMLFQEGPAKCDTFVNSAHFELATVLISQPFLNVFWDFQLLSLAENQYQHVYVMLQRHQKHLNYQ